MSNKLPFGAAVSFAVSKTDNELRKKYKGEKLTKAKQALSYAEEYFSTIPVGFNLGDSQEKLKKDCEEYVKDKFRGPPQMGPDGTPVGFAILGIIIVAIIGWVIRKLLDHFFNNLKI